MAVNLVAGQDPAPTAADLKELRARIAEQQTQIKKLQQTMEEQQKLLDRSLEKLATVSTTTAEPVRLVAAVDLKPRDIVNLPRQMRQDEQKPSPLSIPIGNSTFTPFGFVDFIGYARSTNVGSGLGTSFSGIPYNNALAGHTSELNLNTANSRLGMRVDSVVKGVKVLGYIEVDFYGNQPGSVYQTSNANTLRMRNVFVDLRKDKWEVMAGQDWTMFTPGKKELSPVPSDIFFSQVVDLNYLSALVWARQSQFRLVAHPNKAFTVGLSLENPQPFIGGGVTLPAALTGLAGTELNNGSSTFAAPDVHPDIIGKAAWDGARSHLEAGVLVRTFRVTTSGGNPTVYTPHTATAASGEVNGNFGIAKNVRLIANTFFGDGGGRYIGGTGPDLVLRADGSISPVHSYATSGGFEANPNKNTLLYAYYSGAYFMKNTALDTNGKLVGYGFSGSPLSNNKTIQEVTFGYSPTIWKNANYGALSLNLQYSYLLRNPWWVPAIGPKNAHSNMAYFNLRYTLP